MVASSRVRILGRSPGGEVWSVGCHFMGPDGPVPMNYPDLEGWAERIRLLNTGAVATPGLRALMSSSSFIDSIRCEQLRPDGTLSEVAEAVMPNPVAGTGTLNKPHTTSVAFSLLTGRPGRSRRGRLYWPALNLTLEAGTGRIDTAQCQTLANTMALLLRDIAAAGPTGTNLRPAVCSQTIGLNTPVVQIGVGDVPDTQRRRRDNLTEGYSRATYPPP